MDGVAGVRRENMFGLPFECFPVLAGAFFILPLAPDSGLVNELFFSAIGMFRKRFFLARYQCTVNWAP